jgi:hypothetical protein
VNRLSSFFQAKNLGEKNMVSLAQSKGTNGILEERIMHNTKAAKSENDIDS